MWNVVKFMLDQPRNMAGVGHRMLKRGVTKAGDTTDNTLFGFMKQGRDLADQGGRNLLEQSDHTQHHLRTQFSAALGHMFFRSPLPTTTMMSLMEPYLNMPRSRLNSNRSRIAWSEFCNKWHAFLLYDRGSQDFQRRQDWSTALEETTQICSNLKPGDRPWYNEGIGDGLAAWLLKHPNEPVLHSQLPDPLLITLHVGYGQAVFCEALRGLSNRNHEQDLDRAVNGTIENIGIHARPQYLPAAVNAMGLTVRTLYPRLYADVNQRLHQLDPKLAQFYQHGVGRGSYFDATRMPPSNQWQWIITQATQMTHDPQQLDNLLAGCIFALMMVNMNQPEILEQFLIEESHRHILQKPLLHGIVGCAVTAQSVLPQNPGLTALLTHQPEDQANRSTWKRMVVEPVKYALNDLYPVLQKEDRIADVFRCSEELSKSK